MLESLNTNNLEYQKLTKEEMLRRGILGRLVGACASFDAPTRNGRKYSEKLWENVFDDPIMKERIENGVCYGELGHPADREETDMEKIAVCLAEVPKKGTDGKLRAVFDILNTPNGRILKSLCDYGSTLGISSRGSGDLEVDYDGQEAVNPDTYNCEGFDIVLIPAVKDARLEYVTESLDKKRYNKTLRQKLQESIDKETEDHQKIMRESLDNLGIDLKYDDTTANAFKDEFDIASPQEVADTFDKTVETSDGNLIKPGVNEAWTDTDDTLTEAKFGGYSYTYGVHAIGFDGRDRILAGAKTEEAVVKLAIEQAQKVFENPFMSSNEKYRYIDDMYISNDDTEQLVEPAGFDDYIDGLLGELRSKKDFKESMNLSEKFIITKIGTNTYALAKGNPPIVNDRIKIEADSYEEAKEILINNGYSEDELMIESLDKDSKLTSHNTQSGTFVKDKKGNIVVETPTDDEATEFMKDQKINEGAYTKDELWDKFGTTDLDIINAGNEETVTLKDDDSKQDESLDINESSMAGDYDTALVDELQEALKLNKSLDEKIVSLQKQLSASNAQEMKLHEEIDNLKIKIVKLSDKAKTNNALTEKLSKLEKELEKTTQTALNKKTALRETIERDAKDREVLRESIESRDNKIAAMQKQLADLKDKAFASNKNVNALNEQLETAQKDARQIKEKYSKKLEEKDVIIEKYKKIAKTAVDNYINSRATTLGISPNEIKNRLPESYSFKDINDVCDDLREYNINMNSLPFTTNKLNESVNVSVKNIDNRVLVNNPDDDISETDIKLAERFMR